VAGPEAPLQRKIKAAVKEKWPGAYVVKYHGSDASEAGTPDLLMCVQGYFIALEVKAPQPGESLEHARGRADKLQLYRIEQIKKAGGHGAVVCSVEEAIEEILWALPHT